jgi:hypothetical protein
MTEADIDDLLADIEQQVLQVGHLHFCHMYINIVCSASSNHPGSTMAAAAMIAAATQHSAGHAIPLCGLVYTDQPPGAHSCCLQEIQQELAALEHSEQQDQQRAVAMAEEHMHFLQSAGGSSTTATLRRQQRHGSVMRMQQAQQLQLLSQWLHLHTAANMRCTGRDSCCHVLRALTYLWRASSSNLQHAHQ